MDSAEDGPADDSRALPDSAATPPAALGVILGYRTPDPPRPRSPVPQPDYLSVIWYSARAMLFALLSAAMGGLTLGHLFRRERKWVDILVLAAITALFLWQCGSSIRDLRAAWRRRV